jgi:hypothetical protein
VCTDQQGGSDIDIKCPNCQSLNRETAKFCGNCGFNLQPSSLQGDGDGAAATVASPSAAARDALMPAELAAMLAAARGVNV